MAELVRVFVSHHHSPEEDAFTARLVVHLEAAGADVWIDVVGVGAADFQKRINEALATCNWFVLVLTPAAIASPWVEMEVHAAIRLKAQGRMQGIIQVMAQTVTQDQIPATWAVTRTSTPHETTPSLSTRHYANWGYSGRHPPLPRCRLTPPRQIASRRA